MDSQRGGAEATNAASCGQVEKGRAGLFRAEAHGEAGPRGARVEGRSGLGSETPPAEGGTRVHLRCASRPRALGPWSSLGEHGFPGRGKPDIAGSTVRGGKGSE